MTSEFRIRGRVSALLALLACGACSAHADTVVLKNGRRIVAESAKRQDGKVICETEAGRLTLPESIVERIEVDNASASASRSVNPAAADLPMGPPAGSSSANAEAIAKQVVHDGAIDRAALERLDAAANTGAPDAAARAAEAETAAGRFEFDHGELTAALGHAERALEYAPGQIAYSLNVAYVHLKRAEYTAALDILEDAVRKAPNSPDAARLLGWAYYALNRLQPAVDEWKRAQQLAPDTAVAAALEKAQRDLETETSFRENRSEHFELHYYGNAAPELARDVLPALEEDFTSLSASLGFTPSQPISVILYTQQAFSDITRAPGWVGALNDGKIRIPVQGLTSLTTELGRILKHELTHSFLNEETHGNCPVWFQEGVAQWMEGKHSGSVANRLLALYDNHEDPSLGALEMPWMNLDSGYATIAYAWSLAVVETIEAGSPGDIGAVLSRLAQGGPAEPAMRESLHMSYADLNAATAAYLRSTYLQH